MNGLTNVDWTVYGKIQSIVKSGNTINYTYDGDDPIYMTDYNGMFKISPWFAKRYPSLANFLSKGFSSLKVNLEMRDSWIQNLGIQHAQGVKLWNQMLELGSGPYVTPNRPDGEMGRRNLDINSVSNQLKVIFGDWKPKFLSSDWFAKQLLGQSPGPAEESQRNTVIPEAQKNP